MVYIYNILHIIYGKIYFPHYTCMMIFPPSPPFSSPTGQCPAKKEPLIYFFALMHKMIYKFPMYSDKCSILA